MPLTQTQVDQVEQFRQAMQRQWDGDARFSGVRRHDRPDGSTLSLRWTTAENPRVWFEIAVRPFIPQVRVGVLTDDRWKNEDFEEKIEESGDTMREFVEMGFEEAGLEWIEPPVEHFREETKFFYFATPLDVISTDELGADATRRKIAQMFEGYFHAFGRFLK